MTAPDATAPRRSRRGGGITLGDVARLAGVSPITVSRVVRRPDIVSSATRLRVEDAIRKLVREEMATILSSLVDALRQ